MVPPLLDGMMSEASLLSSKSSESTQPCGVPALDLTTAWTLLRGLRDALASSPPVSEVTGVALDSSGAVVKTAPSLGAIVLRPGGDPGWTLPSANATPFDAATAQLLDLFVPLCIGERAATLALGHLAQSLDGRVATTGGVSQFISGPEDLTHTHRLRAMFDAVIVGAKTVERDDPQLTTRRCVGAHPTRVVLDPRGRLTKSYSMFSDGAAPTILVVGASAQTFAGSGNTEVVPVAASEDWMPVAAVVEALAQRGLRRLFVEGGGITVSGFLKAGALDRMHVTVAPMVLGSGRPSFVLPEAATLEDGIRLEARHFSLGRDVLFDCPLAR